MKRILAATLGLALLLAPAPAQADPKPNGPITVTGVVSTTPATGAAQVAIAVRTAPAAEKKHFATGIKGTVIIVSLAPGAVLRRNGEIVPLSDLLADDKVTITLTSRTGTAAPYTYFASRFNASSPGTSVAMSVSGVIAVAPTETPTSIAVFVTSTSAYRFTPSTSLKNTTITVAPTPSALIVRNGIVGTLGSLKLNDRVTMTIVERTGSVAPYTYLASRIVATAANSTQPVTVTGSIATAPAGGTTNISVYVKNVAYDVGWANDTLKGTTITVGLAAGAVVTRNGESTTLSGLKLDDRVTLTLTERVGTAAPYTYLASRVTATGFTTYPFTVRGTLVSIPDAGTNRLFVYVQSILDDGDHHAFANALKGTAIIVSMAPGGVITRNGATTTMASLRLNDTIVVTIADRTGTTEPFTYLASRVTATGPA